MKIRVFLAPLLTTLLAYQLVTAAVVPAARYANDFDLKDALVPAAHILSGGPPRDGIPAIYQPKFLPAKQADFLNDEDRVLGIERHGVSKAYPINILNWHEIVNDQFASEGIVISFCPLCGSGMAFIAQVDGKRRTFGVSGLLYNSDVLMYDKETESLWSQLMGKAVSGPSKGQDLKLIALSHTSWRQWRKKHPKTLVLSTDTGARRDYNVDPYAGYSKSRRLMFKISHKNSRYHPKEQVIGVALNGHYKAYPFAELSKQTGPINDQLAGLPIKIEFDSDNRSGRILAKNGTEIPSTILFWFAWATFHPKTEVYQTL